MSHAPPPPDPDKLAAAVAAFRSMPVPDRPADDVVLAKLAATPAVEPLSRSRRKLLMRVATWSLAASVLAVAGGVLWFGGSPPVALADVVRAAEKHKLVKYTQTTHNETKAGGAVMPLVETAYADLKAPRSRTESGGLTLNRTVNSAAVFVRDGRKDVALYLITETVIDGKVDDTTPGFLKELLASGKFPRKEARLTPAHDVLTAAGGSAAKTVLENLRELEQHKDAVAAKGKLNGNDVLKYRIEEEHKATLLWVDATTKLPVRLEHELTDPRVLHPTTTRLRYVLSDFEWDPKLPAGIGTLDDLFDTTPPAGYKVVEDSRKRKDDPAGRPSPTPAPAKP